MAMTGKWVIAPPRKTLVVGVADMVASNDAGAELVTYSLGSCLGITVYDPFKKIGGLLHLMLPESKIDSGKAATAPHMFVDTGVPRLFQAVYHLGADRQSLVIKVAGGAQFLRDEKIFNIGERNIRSFEELLARNGLSIQARDVGGCNSRTLRFDLTSGVVTVHSPGCPPYRL